jgi:hypothetical protein
MATARAYTIAERPTLLENSFKHELASARITIVREHTRATGKTLPLSICASAAELQSRRVASAFELRRIKGFDRRVVGRLENRYPPIMISPSARWQRSWIVSEP